MSSRHAGFVRIHKKIFRYSFVIYFPVKSQGLGEPKTVDESIQSVDNYAATVDNSPVSVDS
jgi:hypothetical protein